MNRFILKHKYLVTFVILAVLAWAAYRRFLVGGSAFITLVVVAAIVWGLGTFAFIYLWPLVTYTGFKVMIAKGVDANTSSGIPINTLYAVPTLPAPSVSPSILTTGTHELLYVVGWLDLSKGSLVLHVPDFSGRYYSIQFSSPLDGSAFAYVGKRTTGTKAGDYLVTAPNWEGQVPTGVTRISSPSKSVFIIGRVLVESDSELPSAYESARAIRLTPLSAWNPAH